MGDLNLDLTGNSVYPPYEPIPAGEYILAVKEVETFKSREGGKPMLKVVFSVGDGEHEGRKIYENFSLARETDPAKEVGLNRLKTMLAYATSREVTRLDDSKQLLGLTMRAMVGLQQDEGKQHPPKNVIKFFIPA